MMRVRNLQGYLRSLREPLSSAQCSQQVLGDLDRACVALDAFADLDLAQLTALLTVAEEYRKTGVRADDPLRELLLCLAAPETTPEQFGVKIKDINLKKVPPDDLRALGRRIDPDFSVPGKDKAELIRAVEEAFTEKANPSGARQQRLARLSPVIERLRKLETEATTSGSGSADLKKGMKPLNLAKQTPRDLLAIAEELQLSANKAMDTKQLVSVIEQFILRHAVKKPRTPRAKKQPATEDQALVQQIAQEVLALKARANEPDATVEELDQKLAALKLDELPLDVLLAVARQLPTELDEPTATEAIRKIKLVVQNKKEQADILRV